MPAKDGVAYFPQTAPHTASSAAYRVVCWLYEKDGKWHGEAPELGLSATADAGPDVYTALAGKIAQLRNNGGKPKPLDLKPIGDRKAPVDAVKKILAVS